MVRVSNAYTVEEQMKDSQATKLWGSTTKKEEKAQRLINWVQQHSSDWLQARMQARELLEQTEL